MVMHEFYSKEVASKAVVHQRSALSKQCKRIIMTQEVPRVLLNCSRLLPWEQTVSHVNSMVVRMQYSGYDQQFRYEVVRSAIDAYRRILAMDQQGIRPFYREKEWKKAERESEKKKKKRTWYKAGNKIFSSVIFVPATPESELKKTLNFIFNIPILKPLFENTT